MSRAFLTRLLSSIVLIPFVVILIWWGGWPYGVFLSICIGIAFAEWVNLANLAVKSFRRRAAVIASGFLYLGLAFYEMADLRLNSDNGEIWILILFLCVWSSDTLAYVFGKTFGGPKMTPTISPNKTWAGYTGALLAPALVFPASLFVISPSFMMLGGTSVLVTLFLAGLLMGVTAQSGDLLVSFLKRKGGLKDTGSLIPGHGGILDRIDALLLVIPVFYTFVIILSAE